jgi:hypothetical protein
MCIARDETVIFWYHSKKKKEIGWLRGSNLIMVTRPSLAAGAK